MSGFPRNLCVLACTAMIGVAVAAGQTIFSANSSNNAGLGVAPNGIAATTGTLLFTQPFCGPQQRGIYSENLPSGTSSLVATIPETGQCAENYLAISTGQGGFTAGDTFVSGWATNNSSAAIYKNGSTVFVASVPNSPQGHVGLAFDTVGTFGNNLIVTAQGAVMLYNSAGAAVATYPAPAGTTYSLEGAAVAPLSFSQCPGCLFVTATLSSNINSTSTTCCGVIYTVPAGAPTGTPLSFWSNTPGAEPEGLVFVTSNNLSCSLNGYSYFVSGYATGSQIDHNGATNGAILAWTPAQLAPVVGQILVPDEGGIVSAFSAPNTSTVFSNTGYQLEGSTILPCPSGGCPATFGFWKHHAFPNSMFVNGVATIGCQTYTDQQLLAILNSNNAGGNAVTILGHQLIAAIANYDAGGKQTTAASNAISTAEALLCTNGINLSTGFESSNTTLGAQLVALANTLDNYNSSGSSCEGNGLTLGTH